MKKTIFIFVLTLTISFNSFAQGMPVYDNASFIGMAQQLAALGTQTSQIIKTVEFMSDAKKKIEKVNSAIKDVQTVARLIKRQQDIFSLLNDDLRMLISNPLVTDLEANRLHDRVERLYLITKNDVDLIEQILTNNFFNMEDSDRMESINEAEQRAEDTFIGLKAEMRDYNTIIEFREFRKAVDQARNN